MPWLVSWKKPSWEAEERICSLRLGFDSEMRGGRVAEGERVRVFGRERVGDGRLWRSRERASAVGDADVDGWLLEGVGGGAAPPPTQMFGKWSCRCCL